MPGKWDYLKGFVLVGQLGLVIVVPLLLAVAFSQIISTRFGHDLIVLLFSILAGLYVGLRSAYILFMKEVQGSRREE